ncbi:MAG: hypothetical protein NZ942_02000 [Candidatus Aenigmarchaeota archaeon]|nr:hypothetical protein [Candidatus Aenigmarchaeota archaeon]
MKLEKFIEICTIVLKEKKVTTTTASNYKIDLNTFKKALNILEKNGFVERTREGWLLR